MKGLNNALSPPGTWLTAPWVPIWKEGDWPRDCSAWHDGWEEHAGSSHQRLGIGSCWLSDHITAGCQVHSPAIYGVPGQEQPVQRCCCGSPGTGAKLSFSLKLEPLFLWARSSLSQIGKTAPWCLPPPPPPTPISYQDSTAASIVILWTTWAGARQTSLPDPASQITDNNKKAFTISIFTSDICLTSAASQEELSRQLPIIHLTISKQNAAGSEGGQDGILAKSVSSGLQQTCI